MSTKVMKDDDVMNYVYSKLFKDFDDIESHTLFDEAENKETEGTRPNAEPESKESGGMEITIKPLMVAAQEGAKHSTENETQDEEDDDDGYESPIMRQLRGK